MSGPIPDYELTRCKLATGVELDAVDVGPRDAPVLIFLHGFPESHRTWRHEIEHFRDRFRCIAPDQRGYRGSSRPQAVEAYAADKLVGDVFALADACGVDKFTVVGHDWGGAIAWGVALMGQGAEGTGGRVERLVIANAPHPWLYQRALIESPEQRASAQYIRAFRDPGNDALVREYGLVGLLAKAVKWERSTGMPDAERDRLLADWQDRDAAFGMLNWYRASAVVVPAMDMDAPMPEFARRDFPKVTIPTLVIWALDDLALPPVNIEGMDKLVTDMTLAKVPGSGHFVPWEAPDRVIEAMKGFLG
ncbi:alpha/beta fold hydrolase [Novosphingopyxis sp.]|uniref:alpha/beta fold hydrolase n=1 Tax=Novosphingopyxis sp. TaxID=2709690 RepID=UPI003B5A5DC5